jgi:hypothetical protein
MQAAACAAQGILDLAGKDLAPVVTIDAVDYCLVNIDVHALHTHTTFMSRPSVSYDEGQKVI